MITLEIDTPDDSVVNRREAEDFERCPFQLLPSQTDTISFLFILNVFIQKTSKKTLLLK